MKSIILLLNLVFMATIAKATVYSCEISSPFAKSSEKWNFNFNTEKDNNHIITVNNEYQILAGCVSLRAEKIYLSCVYGSYKGEKYIVSTVIEDGSSVLFLAFENVNGKSTLKCDKQ